MTNNKLDLANEARCVLPALYIGISLDKYIIMLDHIHTFHYYNKSRI